MKKIIILAAVAVAAIACSTKTSKETKAAKESATIAVAANGSGIQVLDKDYAAFVDPFIGSGEHGHVFVGASVPFGAVQLGPTNIHTGWDWCSGYHYSDSTIIGFAHTHLSGTGCADLCDINFMPYTGNLRTYRGDKESRPLKLEGTTTSLFRHDKETCSPGYYSVSMENGVDVELTATDRVGMHHYTYPAEGGRRLLIDLEYGVENAAEEGYIKKIDDRTVEGFRHSKGWSPDRRVYFHAEFSEPILSLATFKGDTPAGENDLRVKNTLPEDDRLYRFGAIKVENVKAVATFAEGVRDLTVKVAISSVSCENARENMVAELPGWDFDAVRAAARDSWNKELGRIDAVGGDREKRIFYTSLFHTMIAPSLYCDVNGEYLGVDGKVHRSELENYSTFSTWDTYRALHPLFTIIERDRLPGMMRSMLDICRQQGQMPIWPLQGGETMCMPGTGSIPILADACLKGIEGIDPAESLELMLRSARNGLRPTNTACSELGYIPDEDDQLSSCMENAVDDWAIALLAKKLGRTDIYEEFMEYGRCFEKYWDPSIMKIRPRLRSGEWLTPYDPCAVREKDGRGHFCEGNGWQYTFMAPQSPEDLIRLNGGDEPFLRNLDSLFVADGFLGDGIGGDVTGLIGMYSHGNEPSHQTAYLFNYAGAPWKTAEIVKRIQTEFYTDLPEGLCGNEDCGEMSAWHVESALGFFQVNPSNGVFVFGTPLFPEMTLNLPGGKKFEIRAKNLSDSNIYIQSVRLDGKRRPFSYVTYDDIMKGGRLEFTLGPRPNKKFGADPAHRPVSAR